MFTCKNFEAELNNTYVELDFDKVCKLADLVESEWVVANTTRITTKFGNKLAVINPEGKFFYANDIIDEKLNNETSYPYTIFITEKDSKNGNKYTTCYIQNTRASIKDYINKRLVLTDMRAVDTKYGEKYVIVTEDRLEMMTSWKKLYKVFQAHKEEIVAGGGLEIYPVIKFSEKYNTEFVGYADKPSDQADELLQTNTTITKKKFINKKQVSTLLASDDSIPF